MLGEIMIMVLPEIQGEMANPIAGIGSLIALVSGAIGVIIMVRKNRNEEKTGVRDYQKDTMTMMNGDIRKLRKHAEKYLILRKIVILDSTVDHIKVLKKMEEEYDLINPDPTADDIED